MRGATTNKRLHRPGQTVSIHAPHAGRDHVLTVSRYFCLVSIHAPHAGRDLLIGRDDIHVRVSIHAPHAGRD